MVVNITPPQEFKLLKNLDIYDGQNCQELATQGAPGRQLRLLSPDHDTDSGDPEVQALAIQLCEDDYPGWIKEADLSRLAPANMPYGAIQVGRPEIETKIPQIIAFTHQAMAQANQYLWGGTVGPNYDCSGLIQAAFGAMGIWLPRDAYQQEAFLPPIALSPGVDADDLTSLDALSAGDLLFFGPPTKATHVALYLGEGSYIHSSGTQVGRNGIGIDRLSQHSGAVGQAYFRQLRGAGRVMVSYQPGDLDLEHLKCQIANNYQAP
jgi:hypothetical protein